MKSYKKSEEPATFCPLVPGPCSSDCAFFMQTSTAVVTTTGRCYLATALEHITGNLAKIEEAIQDTAKI